MHREEIFEVEDILTNLIDSPNLNLSQKEGIERLMEVFVPIAENERLRAYKEDHGIKWSWQNYHPQKKLSDAINTLSNAITFHQEAVLEEESYEKITQDLLHRLELTECDEDEMLEIARELQEIRKKRRNAKDFMTLVKPLFGYSTKNRQVIKELGQVLAEMQSIVNNWDTRTYTAKEKTNFQNAFDKAKESGHSKTVLQEAFEKAGTSNVAYL